MRTRAIVVSVVASLALGCGWLVGVSGDVSLTTDAGDEPVDGAPHPDGTAAVDANADVDAESLEDSEPGRDAAVLDADRDARDD